MDTQRLDEVLAAAGEPKYRASQVWEWVARGVGSYEEMTNLPAGLRARLEADLPLSALSVRAEARSDDGTVKTLFDTVDGRPLEAVLMRYRDGRRSVCVSSQSGCPLTCTFCATGKMKFGRNLTADEILDQALHFRRVEAIDHVVFMGMGEPTMNIDNVLAACERLPDLGVTNRRTSISTVGWVPGIDRLAECEMPIGLALSLLAFGHIALGPRQPDPRGQRRPRLVGSGRKAHAATRSENVVDQLLARVDLRCRRDFLAGRTRWPHLFRAWRLRTLSMGRSGLAHCQIRFLIRVGPMSEVEDAAWKQFSAPLAVPATRRREGTRLENPHEHLVRMIRPDTLRTAITNPAQQSELLISQRRAINGHSNVLSVQRIGHATSS
jgi:hypothetical protein